MKKLVYGFVIGLIVGLALPTYASALDLCQSEALGSTTSVNGWGASSAQNSLLSATIVLSTDCTVAAISAKMRNHSGGSGMDAQLCIRSANDGGGSVLGCTDSGSLSPTGSFTEVVGTVASPFYLVSGTYYLYLTRTGALSNTDYWDIAGDGSDTVRAFYVPDGFWSNSPSTGPLGYALYEDNTPPDPNTGAATSSVDQIQENLGTAFYLFMLSMCIMVWMMRKH